MSPSAAAASGWLRVHYMAWTMRGLILVRVRACWFDVLHEDGMGFALGSDHASDDSIMTITLICVHDKVIDAVYAST